MQSDKKIFKSRFRVVRTRHFRVHNNPFTLNKIFFAKITTINFICLLALFIAQNFKKASECIQSFEGGTIILGPKWPINPNPVLFWKNHQSTFHVPFGPFYCAKLKYDFHVPLGPLQCAKFKKIFRLDSEL